MPRMQSRAIFDTIILPGGNVDKRITVLEKNVKKILTTLQWEEEELPTYDQIDIIVPEEKEKKIVPTGN